MYSSHIFILFLAVSCCITSLTGQECNEALLKNVFKNDPLLKGFVIDNINAPEASLASELPLIGSTDAWTLRYGGNESEFISPLFVLHEEAPGTPHFWLTGIGIQNGYEAGSSCGSLVPSDNSFITKLKVTAGSRMNKTEYVSIQAPYADEKDSGGEPILNLRILGLNNRGRVLKINFPPMAADEVSLQVMETSQPADANLTNSVCLRVEFYGCRRGPGNVDEPDINKGVLLQYIMPYPDARVDGYRHDDSTYTGLESLGLLSGGVGVLTNGALGDTPSLSPAEYFGWSVCGTTDPYIILLFNGTYSIVDVIARVWDGEMKDLEVEDDVFKVYDQNDILLEFDGKQVFNVSFLKIEFSYPAGAMLLLLSEVRFVTESNLNLLTGSNLTLLLSRSGNDTNTTTVNMTNTTNTTSMQTTTYTNLNNTDTDKGNLSANILLITTSILSVVVIILLIIIVIMTIVLIGCCARKNTEEDETNFCSGNSNSNGRRSEEYTVTMESIKTNDARVGGDNVELSESQIYL